MNPQSKPTRPKWNGRTYTVDLTRKVVIFAPGPFGVRMPFITQLEGSEDFFLLLFSNSESAHDLMRNLERVLELEQTYDLCRLDDATELIEAMYAEGIRIMLDPVVVSDHQTDWVEIVKEGDQWKSIETK